MNCKLFSLLLIPSVALLAGSRLKPAKPAKKPNVIVPVCAPPADPPNRRFSNASVQPYELSSELILGCVHAGAKQHASDAETLAAVRRKIADNELVIAPRSIVTRVNAGIPGVDDPMLAFLSDATEANLCLLGRRNGEITLISRADETVETGDPVNPEFTDWLAGALPGERYFLLDTRRKDSEGSEYECLRIYSLDTVRNTLRLNDSACELAGSWSGGALPDGRPFFKGRDYSPTLHDWHEQCVIQDGVGVPKPAAAHRTWGTLTPETYCAGLPAIVTTFYDIQSGKFHIYRTINPPGGNGE